MAKRLITLRQIRDEKVSRSRSWIFAEIAANRFPRPLDTGGRGPNLWEEDVIDVWVAAFVASAKERALGGGIGGAGKVKQAAAARSRRRQNHVSS
jgi:predicted DNA-binding transcriptional regulator AlpA